MAAFSAFNAWAWDIGTNTRLSETQIKAVCIALDIFAPPLLIKMDGASRRCRPRLTVRGTPRSIYNNIIRRRLSGLVCHARFRACSVVKLTWRRHTPAQGAGNGEPLGKPCSTECPHSADRAC